MKFLAKINIIPKHVWEPVLADLSTKDENAESYQEDTPIGSGAYKFVRWLPNEEIVLEANADHFNAPKAERFILRLVPNAEAALGMLRSGELNFLTDFQGDPQVLLDAAEQDGDLEVVSTVDIGFRYVAFNLRRPPFNDPAFRRALSAAVDRRLIVTDMLTQAERDWLNDYHDTCSDRIRQRLSDAAAKWLDQATAPL